MPDVGHGEHVRRPATDAVPRVCRVLERRPADARILDAEDNGAVPLAREVADLRVVAVDDHPGVPVECTNGLAPALGDELELAVAVKLISEQVPEADRARADPARNLGQGGFV